MNTRGLGAFSAGLAGGIGLGTKIRGDLQAQRLAENKDMREAKYYEGIAAIFDDFLKGRGTWAADQPTAPAAPLETPPPASMAPDAAGPPESIGGGTADALMQRSLAQQQPASALARPAAQPTVPGDAMTSAAAVPGARRLPFLRFLGG